LNDLPFLFEEMRLGNSEKMFNEISSNRDVAGEGDWSAYGRIAFAS
jgi:hypothetical protein